MVEKDIFVDASEWCLDRLNLVKEDYLQRFHPMAACFRLVMSNKRSERNNRIAVIAHWKGTTITSRTCSAPVELPPDMGFFLEINLINFAFLLRFLFLLALKIFADANLDVIILEVGLGGRLDATNIIPNPTVCAVTSLGYEHTAILGSSLTQIASEKAGIFKPGSPAITIMQKPEALLALQAKAKIVGAEFSIAPNIDDTSDMTSLDSLGLSAGYQLENASLAVAVARKWEEIAPHINNRQGHQDRLAKLALGQLPEEYAQALRSLYWPGRAHTVKELDNLTFYLDGAHSPESIRACANWYPGFINDLSDCKKNVLLFSCGDDKDPEKLLKLLAHQLHKRAIKMGHAIFAPFIGTKDGLLELPTDSAASTTTKTQTLHLKAWQETMHSLYGGPEMSQKAPGTDSIVASSVKLSIDMVKDIASRSKDVRVLVTGSLYLVGNVLRILGRVPI